MKKAINLKKYRQENGTVIDEEKFNSFKPSVKRYMWIDKYTEAPSDIYKTLEHNADEIMKDETKIAPILGYTSAGAIITAEDETVLSEDQVVSKLVDRLVKAYGTYENVVAIEDALIKSYKNDDGKVYYVLTTFVKGTPTEKQFK